ncbi:L-2,4-diaminobutyrate decarboxylase [Lecanosticta acicola]|uniref:L-2,4-diaminobutyrate decarboxylase n=1 Tax=Lecanosticta acicola TaxID=111012 RepID=A0AAI8YX26_9PEZI|nr:L-2,4-diaminobutyrate decarboxylase [Lecanosticta acicola]
MRELDRVTPPSEALETCRSKLLKKLPQDALGLDQTSKHLQEDIAPGLNRSSQSPNFYGFVTGGATPAAKFADNMVTEYDQFVQIHQPQDTISTEVEDAALRMLCDLVDLPEEQWQHRTFTTGATASNIVGLACGREFVLREAAKQRPVEISISEDGIYEAMCKTGIDKIQILTTAPHSSLGKAASILGLGRKSISQVGLYQASHHFDFARLEELLQTPRAASIIVVSCGEVNTGFFATSGDDMRRLRALADRHHAWIHIDAAFGLQARCLPHDDPQYRAIVDGIRGLELADSIAGDAHKLLNVPYDCGIFLSRHLELGIQVFQNVGAAYLSSSSSSSSSSSPPSVAGGREQRPIPSPLNIGIENSRRFRALPVYATLAAHGRTGHQKILKNQIALARGIARFISSHPALELLPRVPASFAKPKEQRISTTYIVVLFRAVDDAVNAALVGRINATRRIYVSGTRWDG